MTGFIIENNGGREYVAGTISGLQKRTNRVLVCEQILGNGLLNARYVKVSTAKKWDKQRNYEIAEYTWDTEKEVAVRD